jgi:hypothetical protein
VTERKPEPTFAEQYHIGSKAELLKAIEKAQEAQRAFEATPEGRAQKAEAERVARLEETDAGLRPYRAKRIPMVIARALLTGKDQLGLKIRRTILDDQIEAIGAAWFCIVFGTVGTGKSLAVCRWLMKQPTGSLYALARDVASLSPKFDKDRQKLELLRQAPAMVLDELRGKKESSDEERARISDLLQWRSDNEKPTLCAANMNPKQDWPSYGERIGRRSFPPLGIHLRAKETLCTAQQRRLKGIK